MPQQRVIKTGQVIHKAFCTIGGIRAQKATKATKRIGEAHQLRIAGAARGHHWGMRIGAERRSAGGCAPLCGGFGPEESLAGIPQPIAAWTDAVEALESGGKVGELLEIELGGDRFYG